MDGSFPLPIIHQYLCTGCGECISHCPTRALAMDGGKARVVEPDHCTYCALCEELCPSSAIALPYLIVFGDQPGEAQG